MTLQSRAGHDPEIAALGPWFHNLHLRDGRQTAPDHPLGDFPGFKWNAVAPHLPEDLAGWAGAHDNGPTVGSAIVTPVSVRLPVFVATNEYETVSPASA